MNWTLGGVRIFVTGHEEGISQIIARIQPLSGGTINQVFGYEGIVTKISCYIVGDSDKDSIEAFATTGSTYELTSPEGSLGTYLVSNVSVPRINTISQTLRPDLDCDAEVYNAEIVLFKET